MPATEDTRLNLSAGLAAVALAGVLVIVKLWAMSVTGALTIAASMADSALDLLVSLAGVLTMIYAARPPDEDHAFGHSSAEDLGALAQSIFITITALAIFIAAGQRLLSPEPVPLRAEGLGIAVMIGATCTTAALVFWQRRVARRTGNRVVAADSLHYAGDALFNLGAILSLLAARFGLVAIDSIAAIAAALVLLVGALRIGRQAFDALMDRQADPAISEAIADLTRGWPGVHGFHDLKTRTAGSRVFVNLHIELDGGQSLAEAHAIGASLRRAILERYPQCDVIIHKDVAGARGSAGVDAPQRSE